MSKQHSTPLNNDEEHTSAPQKVAVITTGGTIACTSDANGHLLPTVSGADLLAPIAPRFNGAQIAFEIHEINRLDSSSMTFEDLDSIIATVHKVLEDPDVVGVVVTHGTDSMEESAIAVDTFLDDPRPVIFTGAQNPSIIPKPTAQTTFSKPASSHPTPPLAELVHSLSSATPSSLLAAALNGTPPMNWRLQPTAPKNQNAPMRCP